MKKIKFISLAVALVSLLGLIGCQNTDDITNVKSALTVVMDNSAETLLKSQKTVQFDSGYIYVTGVEIYGEIENENHDMDNDDNDGDTDNDGDSKDDHYDTDGSTYFSNTVTVNTRINLVTGAYEVPVEFDLLQANYDDIKLNINLDASAQYPAIEVYGTYYDLNGNPVPVAFIYNDSITIRTKYDDDNDDLDEDLIVADSVPAFVIYVSPAKWFKDLSSETMENATRYDGVILINDTANVDIYNNIIQNIGKECYMKEESRERWEHEYHSEDYDD